MKTFRLITLTVFVVLFCFGLHSTSHAQGIATVTVSTPATMIPPSPINPSVGTTYEYYSSVATPNTSGITGELIAGDETYLWTAKITRWQSGSGYVSCNAPIAFKFPVAPYSDTSTSPSTDIQTQFLSSGYYQITLTVKMTYNLRDQHNLIVQSGLTATGSASCQVEVVVPDFSLNANGNSLIIPLDSSASVAVTAIPINNFIGDVQLSLNASNPNPGQTHPGPNPVGVTLGSSATDPSLFIVLSGSQKGSDPITSNGPVSVSPMLHVAANAPTGTFPLTIYGVGSDLNGPPIEHNTSDFSPEGLPVAQLTVTIPKRYAEITCPPYDSPNGSPPNMFLAGVPNNRSIDGSISVDAAAIWIFDSVSLNTGGWYGKGNLTTQNERGFAYPKTYAWAETLGGQNADISGSTYGGLNGNTFFLDDKLTLTLQPAPGVISLNKSSSVNVAITNYAGTLLYPLSYAIRWHYPYENWQKVGSAFADNPPYSLFSESLTPSVIAGNTLSVTLPNATFSASG